MPEVSIIIPVYNAEKVIRRAVDSVLSQEFEDFELLLMDDGSKDGSPAILDEYAAGDARVRVVHKANSGVSDTRNQALDMARGKYIQFLDADDWITKDATKLMVRAMVEHEADMVITDFYRVVEKRTARKGDIGADTVLTREEYADYMMENPADYYYGVIWNKLFRNDVIRKYQLRMDKDLRWCEDFIFNMEYVLHIDRIYALQVPVYYYVKTEGSLVWQGMNISNIVRMKLNVIEYYTNFYKQIYDEEEYELRKPKIYSFLVAYAGDDGAIPGMPGTRKLGRERVDVNLPLMSEDNVFTDLYYSRKLLDSYQSVIAQENGLELPDIKLLQFLRYSPVRRTHAAADFTELSLASLLLRLQKLVLRKFVRYTLDTDEMSLNAELTEDAEQVFRKIDEAAGDYMRIRSGEVSEEMLAVHRAEAENVRKRLFR